jgi:uncharacterized membrane protein YbhN (UPF0104 family)
MRQIKSALEVLKDPKRLLTAIGGQIGTEVLYASGHMLCVLALGGSVNLGQALFINITVALFAGIMPVPGGVGVSSDIALPAVVLYRPCSYYLPALVGLGEPAVADSPRLPLNPNRGRPTSRSPRQASRRPATSSLLHER